jgi:hypothetical protein
VVARRQEDGPRRCGEAGLQEGDGIGRHPNGLEQVAGRQDGVHLLLIGQGEDALQRLAAVAASAACGLRSRPGEGGVQVEVCEQEELHAFRG